MKDRDTCGVRIRPGHWASQSVHAFKSWTGERTLSTWCELDADLADGAVKTTETITCSACAEVSFRDMWRWVRDIRWDIPRGVRP